MTYGPNDQPNTVYPGTLYLSVQRMDSAITSVGRRFLWRQSHICPCGATTGSPDPLCLQCGGQGRYWDAPSTPFIAALAFSIPDDPSQHVSVQAGAYTTGMPMLSIPQIAGTVWQNATLYDQFVLPDATQRFTINLINGTYNKLPYTYGVSVPASGAVNYYNSQTRMISGDNNYVVSTVNGITSVTLSDQPTGTQFSVEYTAQQAYVAFLRGGEPHIRPDVAGLAMPKRFQLQFLDIWLRGHSSTGNP